MIKYEFKWNAAGERAGARSRTFVLAKHIFDSITNRFRNSLTLKQTNLNTIMTKEKHIIVEKNAKPKQKQKQMKSVVVYLYLGVGILDVGK